MLRSTIPNDHEAGGLVIEGLEVLEKCNRIVLIPGTVLIDDETLGGV